MKPTGEGGGGGGGEVAGVEEATTVVEGSALLIVGVKPDEWSREVLTWSLVNVARPGDRIVALHVLDYPLGSTSLISLVRSFDTMLGVYESFCNLKQVDLKLKVFRGKSARKVLVQEVKSCGATSLIVGSSRRHHTIRSSASLAKYCARNLSKDVSVFAVKSGKIMFRRVPNTNGADGGPHMNLPSLVCGSPDIVAIEAAKIGNNFSPARTSSRWTRTSRSSSLQSPDSLGVDNSLALVPVNANGSDSGSLDSGPGWHFLRGLYSHRKSWTKVSAKKAVLQWVSKLRGRHSEAVIYLDRKRSDSNCDEDCSSSIDGEDASVSRSGSELTQSPFSPCIGSNIIPEELEGLHEKYSSTCRLFTYDEVLTITSNFSSENLIGEGGNSYVYRGDLPDGRELAVKILKPCLDVLKEFILEIEVITSVHHKNIVSLFGFGFENNNLMLVYDYLPRGSLEENLHGSRKDAKKFGWLERYKVAVGVAEAIDYLHNTHDPEVIHRDVKSSNVLLADDFEPQLSDFGFASLASSASQHVSGGDIAGTFGYLAPEYFMHGKVTDKIDVYAFGVVLLELLSGRKPICIDQSKGQESLVLWANPILESGKFAQLLDPSLENDNSNDLIEKLLLAATLCIKRTPYDRPLQENMDFTTTIGDYICSRHFWRLSSDYLATILRLQIFGHILVIF